MEIEELLKEKPELTIGMPEAPQIQVVPEERRQQIANESQYLSEEEKQQVETFVKQIQLEDSRMIMQYGTAAQKKMSNFSEGTLDQVRAKDLGEIGNLLNGVVCELKGFNEEEKKGILGFFKKKGQKIEALKLKYDKAENSIDVICDKLQSHQVQLMKDAQMFDKMYELNKLYFRELTMYILAGKKKLEEEQNITLPKLREQAERSRRQEDAQAVNDREALCTRFEKRIYDLELTRMVSLQMSMQIRMVQSSDVTMSEKIQSTIMNTIPLWKSQMIIALGTERAQKAAEAQRAVSDLTNDILKKNAEKLKMATIETAKESERGIVDIETLISTNESLISTIDEVMQIQDEGRRKRREAEEKLVDLENELRNKLLYQGREKRYV